MASEKEKSETKKVNSQIKHVPKDAQVIMSILKELGIQDYEPRVVNQLLEFTYRYVTCILDDAKVFANHAKKKTLDLEDVKLACDMVLDKAFTCPPPRHVLTKLAEIRNSMPLPPIKPHCGLRLPPDRYCLTATNYRLRTGAQTKKLLKSAIDARSTIKSQVKSQAGVVTAVKRGPPPLAIAKTQITTIPKPVFKFSTQPKQIAVNPNVKVPQTEVKMEIDGSEDPLSSRGISGITVPNPVAASVVGTNDSNNLKREREDDDFEIVT